MDLSIVSQDLLASSIWSVFPDTSSSDHYPVCVEITLDSNFTFINNISHKINLRNVDWSIFNKHLDSLDENVIQIFDNKSIQQKYDFIIDFIFEAIDKSKPKSNSNSPVKKRRSANKLKKNPHAAPWWDENCDKLSKERRNSLNFFLHNASMDNWISYKKTKAKGKRELRKIKIKKFREFTESLSREKNLNIMS